MFVDDDSKVTVRTVRSDGKVLVTPYLVRMDSESGWIMWGCEKPHWLSKLDSRSLKWERRHSTAWVWSRVDECPVRPKKSESRFQKDACRQEDYRGASGSAGLQGKQGRSQNVDCCPEAASSRRSPRRPLPRGGVKKAEAVAHSAPEEKTKKVHRLAPPPFIAVGHSTPEEKAKKHRKLTQPPFVKKTKKKLAPPPFVAVAHSAPEEKVKKTRRKRHRRIEPQLSEPAEKKAEAVAHSTPEEKIKKTRRKRRRRIELELSEPAEIMSSSAGLRALLSQLDY